MTKEKSRSFRKGRSLELLVKRIKEHQLPDAVILSPEFVPDKDTGQPREIDIGIRVPRGDAFIFIAVECRDRVASQSVEWIEQLICKKQSIGADILVAVTSSKFSKPARIKALKHGVILASMSSKLPEELAELASEFFVTIRFLAPRIVGVELQVPSQLNDDLESYRYRHDMVGKELNLNELALVWTTPDLVRTIPRFVKNWDNAKYAKIKISEELNAWLLSEEQQFKILQAQISYELNYGELEIPLRSAQELSMLDESSDSNATSFIFGGNNNSQSEIIVDEHTGHLRWDLLGKSFLGEGKVIIGGGLKASKPVCITTMRLDL